MNEALRSHSPRGMNVRYAPRAPRLAASSGGLLAALLLGGCGGRVVAMNPDDAATRDPRDASWDAPADAPGDTPVDASRNGPPDSLGIPDVTPVDVPAPRLIAPLSTANVTNARPTLRVELPAGVERVAVEVCPDRACARVEATHTLTPGQTTARLTEDLRPGVHYWRARGRTGAATGTATSATWEFFVPAPRAGATATPFDGSYGATLDLDGDGLAEVAAGAPGSDEQDVEGDVDVFTGGPRFETSQVRTRLHVAGANHLGASLASAGDVNGDGYGDLIVGSGGVAYVYLGGARGVGGATPRVIAAPTGVRHFGAKVAAAGDLDHDGYGDVLVTAFRAFSDQGRAFVYYGDARGGFTRSTELPNPRGLVSYGQSVAGVGDINGDGHPDVLVGAPGAEASQRLQLLSGTGAALSAPVALPAMNAENLGVTAALAGDVNGDGLADFFTAANESPVGSLDLAGFVHVYHGRSIVLPGAPATRLQAVRPTALQRFGSSLAGGGDVNGDGYDDVLVGTYLTDDAASFNTATLFTGGPGGVATTGVELYSATLAAAGSGATVAIPGDVNGDGYDDVVVGAPGYERGAGAGAVYVIFGASALRAGAARVRLAALPESPRYFGASVATR